MKPLRPHDLHFFDQLIIFGLDYELVLSPVIPLNDELV